MICQTDIATIIKRDAVRQIKENQAAEFLLHFETSTFVFCCCFFCTWKVQVLPFPLCCTEQKTRQRNWRNRSEYLQPNFPLFYREQASWLQGQNRFGRLFIHMFTFLSCKSIPFVISGDFYFSKLRNACRAGVYFPSSLCWFLKEIMKWLQIEVPLRIFVRWNFCRTTIENTYEIHIQTICK